MANGVFWRRRSIRLVLAAAIVGLFSMSGAARASCTNCSLDGPGVGTSNGTAETGQGDDAFGSGLDVGLANSAFGEHALRSNTMGGGNIAIGVNALVDNTTGSGNTATGESALQDNMTGGDNTAVGSAALESNTGNDNTAVGVEAGINLTTGDDNIDIGNSGVGGESDTIRIGDPNTHTATYVAGIFGAKLPVSSSGLAALPRTVLVDSSGHLGTGVSFGAISSARYKRDIRNMGNASAGLLKLRPVSFRYKEDPKSALQYGLVAEEVERVYPALVTHADDGKVMGVR